MSYIYDQENHELELEYRPVCGVLATAIAADIPFSESFNYYRENRVSKRGKSWWTGSTTIYDWIKAFENYNVKYKILNLPSKRKTIAQYIIEYTKPNTTYMIHVYTHVVLIYNGMIYDQGGMVPYTEHRDKQCRVKTIFQLEKNPPFLLTEFKKTSIRGVLKRKMTND